ncbi:MAG: hypothetical protein HY094_03900 [Candidatus Melainabacteria bacterium]|nr:hypothetical protein [Candidatus Melainabacteria bacterium]
MVNKIALVKHPIIPFHLKQLFGKMPTTDIHMHIGGSTPKPLIKTFMKENGVREDEIPNLMQLVKHRYESTTEIARAYDIVPRHVSTPSQFHRATIGIIKEAAKDNVKIAEPRTSILNKGGKPLEIVEAVEDGIREGTTWVKKNFNYDMKVYLGILAQRLGTPEESLKTAKLAVEFAERPGSMIHSFDLAGDESRCSIEEHEEAIRYIKKYGPEHDIGLTIHAGERKTSGEISGVESIRKAIEYGADRLAHVLMLMHDDELRKYVIENRIPVETPPWGNAQTGAIDNFSEHPIGDWLDEGMNCNLVTDNRFMSGINQKLQMAQLWTNGLITKWEQFKQLTTNGIKAAFISQEEKEIILAAALKEFTELESRFDETISSYLS